MIKKLHLTFMVLILVLSNISAQTPLTSAPDITVKTIKGDIISLYSLLAENKVVVVDFFSVSCGPCQTFAHDFEEAYQGFGANQGNVFFLGVNYNGTNADVIFFDSVFDITLPSCSGLEGGGNLAFETFQISAYPTVVVVQPDKTIAAQHVWEPTFANITDAVINAGGLFVGQNENHIQHLNQISFFPQPARDHVKIGFDCDQSWNQSIIMVRDLTGRVVFEQKLETLIGKNTLTLETEQFQSGHYVVEVVAGSQVLVGKLVIQ